LEDGLELTVDVRGGKEVFSSGDVGDVLKSVVDHYCEMVCGADVFSG